MSARRAAQSLRSVLRQFEHAAGEGATHCGVGPSTSYGPALRGLRSITGRRTVLSSLQTSSGRLGERRLRHEVESFLRQWRGRGFKAVAAGSMASTSAGLYNLMVPTALWMLWCCLPARYRHLAFQLMGYPDCKAQQPAQRHGQHDGAGAGGQARGPLSALLHALGLPELLSAAVHELLLAVRALYLCALFMPALLAAPVMAATGMGRDAWLALVVSALESAGPAFIKWGQWASTRPDLFPEDLCLRLEQLQVSAPAHTAAQTVDIVERAFNAPIPEMFDQFDAEPVASGSIAQVHFATVSARGAELSAAAGRAVPAGTRVAVKVRHPGVSDIMHRDFILMQRAAALCSVLPALKELRLEESIRQFGGPLKEQLDLSVEASHLSRFNANFRAWSNVAFPVPLYPFVTPDVLVESFEDGDLIMRYVRTPHRHNAALAQTGVNVFLSMMLRDNFIHADLHPGNIIVKPAPQPSPLALAAASWLPARVGSWLTDRQPRIVLLDTGMIVELSSEDQSSLLGFFRSLTQMDGQGLADAIMRMSVGGACKDPVGFAAELEAKFRSMDREYLRRESQAVMKDIIETMRQHQLTLRSSVSTVVVTSLVLEGWSSKLDPDVRILDTMRDMLATDWRDRVSRTVDRLMASGQTMELVVA